MLFRSTEFVRAMDEVREHLTRAGYVLTGDEPLKLTISAHSRGYTGTQLAALLAQRDLVCEFSDPDYVVLMLTPENGTQALTLVERVLSEIPEGEGKLPPIPPMCKPERWCSPRRALMCAGEERDVNACRGMVLTDPMVGCPPAVPILVCGEVVDEQAIELMTYYGVKTCRVASKEMI